MGSTILSYRKLEALVEKKTKQCPLLSLSSIGKSIDGRDIWCVTIQKPTDSGTKIVQNRKSSVRGRKKIPIVITASIHGHEATGSIALLRFLNKIQKDGDSTKWLDDLIVFCVICCNPDGYVHNTRYNAEGFDINRDFITQSQPETESIVNLIVKEKPAVVLDLHGYVWKESSHIGLIEPCTPPHNPAYEYDLYLKEALPLAQRMEAFLIEEKEKFSSKRFKSIKGTYIPYRDGKGGWDDYSHMAVRCIPCCMVHSG
jgi:Zinc carboxypeptidase